MNYVRGTLLAIFAEGAYISHVDLPITIEIELGENIAQRHTTLAFFRSHCWTIDFYSCRAIVESREVFPAPA